MLQVHNGIKLDNNNRKIPEKSQIEIKPQTSKQWVKVSREIKKHLIK